MQHPPPIMLKGPITEVTGPFARPGLGPAGMRSRGAFSLVELLVVIAVIAIIAAIAVPNIADVTRAADSATRIQNAHLVASTYNAYATMYASTGQGAPPFSDRDSAVAAIITPGGIAVTNARLGTTNFFYVPVPSTNEIAIERLSFADGQLIYTP